MFYLNFLTNKQIFEKLVIEKSHFSHILINFENSIDNYSVFACL